MKKNTRLILSLGGAVIAAACLAGAATYQFSAHSGPVLSTGTNEVGGTFRLVTVVEDFVTDADYRGKWMLVYFGDAHCPADQCGRTLSAIETAVVAQGPLTAKIAPLFITLDPVRDDSTTLHNYAKQFGSRIQPLTGSLNMIKAVAAEYHVPWEERPLDGGDHYMRPASQIVIMDPAGHYAGTIEATASSDAIAARLAQLLHAH